MEEHNPPPSPQLNGDTLPARATTGFRSGDLFKSEVFARTQGRDTLYVHTNRTWAIWDEARWREDHRGKIYELGKETLSGTLQEEAPSMRILENMLKAAQTIPGIAVTVHELDADPWMFNTQNGTIDLRGNEAEPARFLSHDRRHLITKIAGGSALLDAPCPKWEEFILWAMGGDQEMVEYLQRAVGYSMTGLTNEQCLFLCWGTGSNGKSTFLNLVQRMLGDYAMQTPFETVLQKKYESDARSDLAALVGSRFVRASEGDKGRRLSESVVKLLTGEDSVTCRRLYGHFFTYRPQFKLWIATNNKPMISGQDYGIWRRIHLIPWAQSVSDIERRMRPHFEQELLQEIDGILMWALRGLLDWKEGGLRPPETVRAATAAYREESDTLGEFLADQCEIAEGLRVSNELLYERYVKWSERQGEMKRSNKWFSKALLERGFEGKKMNTGRFWFGITIGTEPTPGSAGSMNGSLSDNSVTPAPATPPDLWETGEAPE